MQDFSNEAVARGHAFDMKSFGQFFRDKSGRNSQKDCTMEEFHNLFFATQDFLSMLNYYSFWLVAIMENWTFVRLARNYIYISCTYMYENFKSP